MTDIVLAINAGSSSIKYAVYCFDGEASQLRCLFRGAIEDIGSGARLRVTDNELAPANDNGGPGGPLPAATHAAALHYILDWLKSLSAQYKTVAVGHRVVHGATRFTQPVVVDKANLARLKELVPLAPLHQPHSLHAIEYLRSLHPDLLQVACFDTAFHAGMPRVEHLFALPRALGEQGIRRYGFHGLSYEYIAGVLPEYLGERSGGRVVVAHLGHGVSLCAMKSLKSLATTMSFTPLDGLPMATRCGAIDAAVVLYLLSEVGMTVEEVSDLLHHQSGLLGLSGISSDMRTLLQSWSADAAEAVAVFVQRVQRELGSLAAALGGLDALVFTGGIGEYAVPVRAAICRAAAWLGVALDVTANAAGNSCISKGDSRVSVWIIPTDEEQVIARHTFAALGLQPVPLQAPPSHPPGILQEKPGHVR